MRAPISLYTNDLLTPLIAEQEQAKAQAFLLYPVDPCDEGHVWAFHASTRELECVNCGYLTEVGEA